MIDLEEPGQIDDNGLGGYERGRSHAGGESMGKGNAAADRAQKVTA